MTTIQNKYKFKQGTSLSLYYLVELQSLKEVKIQNVITGKNDIITKRT